MPNNIPVQQNSQFFTDLRAASCQAYQNRMFCSRLQLVLAATVAIVGPAMTALNPSLEVWSGLFGFSVVLVDIVFLEPLCDFWQEFGAKIQEIYDIGLYHLPWNKLLAGDKPDEGKVASLAYKHKKKHPDDRFLLDWYPTAVGAAPLEYARFICQRSNLRWDSDIRRFYSYVLIALLIFLFVGSIGFSTLLKWDTQQYVLGILVPLIPTGIRIWRELSQHRKSSRSSEKCKAYLEDLWSRAIQNAVPLCGLEDESRMLQDEIFLRRKQAASVPRLVYLLLRKDYERQMREAAAKMSEEANCMQPAT